MTNPCAWKGREGMIFIMRFLGFGWKRAGFAATVIALGCSGPVRASDGEESLWVDMVCPMETPRSARAIGGVAERAPTMTEAPSPERDLRFVQWIGLPVERSTAWQFVTVKPGEIGLTIYATVRDPGLAVSIDVRGPGGQSLTCRACDDAPVVGEEKEFRGSVQIPSTDRPGNEIEAGTYAFRVTALPVPDFSQHGDLTTIADVLAAVRANAGVQVDQFLDLNFVYLPGIPLDAATAQSTPEFAELLDLVEFQIAPLGIKLGAITHVDLNRPEFTHLSSWTEAGQLLRTSAEVGRARALNVFCVGIFDEEFLNVGGLSGGIPGAAVNGTRDSGIAIRIAPSYPNFLPAYGTLVAHEIGHYLGFYHTTEGNLEREDPLSDTPRCNEPDLHACPDWNYHMFPIAHVAMTEWSPSQIGIAPTHPIVRTVPVAGQSALDAPVVSRAALRASPNPFSTAIEIFGARSRDSIEIFDVLGRRIRVLEAGSAAPRVWDGLDQSRRPAPAGTYFLRIREGDAGPVLRIVRLS